MVTPAQAEALRSEPDGLPALLDATWEWLEGEQAPIARRVMTLADGDYPANLLQTEDPPLVLYLMGQVPAPWPVGVAVVGSRNPTPQGLANARQFSRSFAQAGLTVVSGMALGIDGAAHEGALEGAAPGQLATIAVVGTGLDRVYPRHHLELAHRIAQRGLLVSEYPLGTPPLPPNFPKRNRIISALSQGTLVVEAALRSGSLITARQAAEQGREVFAIPGSIHSTAIARLPRAPQAGRQAGRVRAGRAGRPAAARRPQARGARRARKDGAEPASGDDDAPQDSLLAALGYDPVTLDALVARTGIAPAELQAKLLELELEGEVSRLPGGLFQRVGFV